MSFALILPNSRPLVARARLNEPAPDEADRVASELRADFERWSRWWLGLGGFVLAAGGAFVAIGVAETARMLGGSPVGVDAVIIAIASLLTLLGIAMLLMLWWTGRRLLVALTWWLRLPYTHGGRKRRAGGWLRTRTVNLEPRVFMRVTTGTLALLVAIGGIALFVRDLIESGSPFTIAAAVVGLLAALAGAGQIGGVMRMVSGISESDPLWARLRSGAIGR